MTVTLCHDTKSQDFTQPRPGSFCFCLSLEGGCGIAIRRHPPGGGQPGTTELRERGSNPKTGGHQTRDWNAPQSTQRLRGQPTAQPTYDNQLPTTNEDTVNVLDFRSSQYAKSVNQVITLA